MFRTEALQANHFPTPENRGQKKERPTPRGTDTSDDHETESKTTEKSEESERSGPENAENAGEAAPVASTRHHRATKPIKQFGFDEYCD